MTAIQLKIYLKECIFRYGLESVSDIERLFAQGSISFDDYFNHCAYSYCDSFFLLSREKNITVTP